MLYLNIGMWVGDASVYMVTLAVFGEGVVMALLRLDKLLVSQGIGSRSDVQRMVRAGRVAVAGDIWKDPARKLDPSDCSIAVDGVSLHYQQHVYIMMNKPAGLLCVSRDPAAPTVLDILPQAMRRPGLFPAGRLDKDTVGLVLITDDGDFAHRLLAPRSGIIKRYRARIDGPVNAEMIRVFDEGVILTDGTRCRSAFLQVIENGDDPLVEIHISEGRYHQIKRMFGAFNHKVLWLKRISMGGLFLDESLQEGDSRVLTSEEYGRIFNSEG